jgi:hypothetical protein
VTYVYLAGVEPNAFSIPPSKDAKAIMLDFMQPVRPRWRLLGGTGRHGWMEREKGRGIERYIKSNSWKGRRGSMRGLVLVLFSRSLAQQNLNTAHLMCIDQFGQ